MSTQPATRLIEVFRPGTFTPQSGKAISFTADDLKGIAARYNHENAPAPAVVGHPTTDAPAYGWAKSFRYDEDSQRLLAEIGDIQPAFSDAVQAGHYKKISLSFFGPDAANNPSPGGWYPKHIGFLGAAAPAVPGLKPVSFTADMSGVETFEFGDAQFGEAGFRDVAQTLRSIRDWMIGKFGKQTADEVVPSYQIEWIDSRAGEPERLPALLDNNSLNYTAPNTIRPKVPLRNKPAHFSDAKPETPPMTTDALTAKDAEIAALKVALATSQTAIANRENQAFAETLVSEGRLLPVASSKVVALLDGLSAAPSEVSFSEGSTTKTAPTVELLKEILKAQPVTVNFAGAALNADEEQVSSFSAPDNRQVDSEALAIHAKAVAYQKSHPQAKWLDAVSAVS